ncbi:uncharacterized protein G2W53_021770 [Senna tora]|uniref:Uncharacterized protein n=1 Tax=Senna tora TaxID=362788 RepID=A0A834WLF0_9FABA|nr:uncharacterized protein G2W53_021770 [Senna tora]
MADMTGVTSTANPNVHQTMNQRSRTSQIPVGVTEATSHAPLATNMANIVNICLYPSDSTKGDPLFSQRSSEPCARKPGESSSSRSATSLTIGAASYGHTVQNCVRQCTRLIVPVP